MTIPRYAKSIIRILLLFLLILCFFLFGFITGIAPRTGFLLAAFAGFLILYYLLQEYFAYLFVFTLCFSALLNLPFTAGGFSSAIVIATASLGLGIVKYLVTKDDRLIKLFTINLDHFLPIIFFFLMIVSLKNSKAIPFSFKQIQQFFYILIIYYFLNLTIHNRLTFNRLLFAFYMGGTIVGLLGIIEGVLKDPVYSMMRNRSLFGANVSDIFLNYMPGRINGVIGDSPYHGIFTAIIAIFSVYYLLHSKKRYSKVFFILVFLLSFANILGSGSRGAFLAFMIGLTIVFIKAKIPHKGLILTLIFFFGFFLILFMSTFVTQLDVGRTFNTGSNTKDTSALRLKNIPVALKIFSDYPVFGSGPDGFIINFKQYARPITNYDCRVKILRTHNTPLQILCEYGIIGFIAFFLIVFMAVKRLFYIIRNSSNQQDILLAASILACITSYCFFMLTSNTLIDHFFWLSIIMARIFYAIFRKEEQFRNEIDSLDQKSSQIRPEI